jgi:hypothetical protein
LIGELLEAQEDAKVRSKRPKLNDEEEMTPLQDPHLDDDGDIQISIKNTVTGKITDLMMWRYDTLWNIKKKVEILERIPLEHQVVRRQDKTMIPSDFTLAWLGIRDHETLLLTPTTSATGSAPSPTAAPIDDGRLEESLFGPGEDPAHGTSDATGSAAGSAGPSSSCPSCAALRTELNRIHGLIHELGEEDYFFGTSTFLPP